MESSFGLSAPQPPADLALHRFSLAQLQPIAAQMGFNETHVGKNSREDIG